ncbi:hypothetical protein H5410_048875, partial [Solanum commersonii]
ITCSCHNFCPSSEHYVHANYTEDVNYTGQALCDRLDSEGIEGDRSRIIRVIQKCDHTSP